MVFDTQKQYFKNNKASVEKTEKYPVYGSKLTRESKQERHDGCICCAWQISTTELMKELT